MRTMRRTDRQKDREFALALFSTCTYAILCTVDMEGNPYAVPICVVLEGDHFYFHCAPDGTKTDNITHNSHVSLVCVGTTHLLPEQFSLAYESAIAYGQAIPVLSAEEKNHALQAICQRYAQENQVAVPQYIESMGAQTAVYRIDIQQITAKARANQRKHPS
ncbi:MAG: pyridoxamine 5'-phosphate oxidase family protein [Sphaerochaetaceae bacterium]